MFDFGATVVEPVLKLGSKGEAVSTAQKILNTFGFNLVVDGVYGSATAAAVKDFQAAHTDSTGTPLVVDGIIGPKTWWALKSSPLPGGAIYPKKEKNILVWVGIIAALLGAYLIFTSDES